MRNLGKLGEWDRTATSSRTPWHSQHMLTEQQHIMNHVFLITGGKKNSALFPDVQLILSVALPRELGRCLGCSGSGSGLTPQPSRGQEGWEGREQGWQPPREQD